MASVKQKCRQGSAVEELFKSLAERLHWHLRDAYRKWAYFVVDHAAAIIIFCVTLTIVCTVKMVTTPQVNNIRNYAPFGARALYEYDVREEFFDEKGAHVTVHVLVVPLNGSNLLSETMLREIIEVDDVVMNNITIFNPGDGSYEPFAKFCHRFCKFNEPVHLFYEGYKQQKKRLADGHLLDDRIDLSYPISTFYGREFKIQPNFFGIHFKNESHHRGTNVGRRITNMDSVEIIVFTYRAERHAGWTDATVRDYEMRVAKYFQQEYQSNQLHVMSISTTYAEQEIARAGKAIIPYLGVGLVVMMICSSVTTTFSSVYMQEFTVYKLPLAILGCLCPLMASGTALGLLFFLGMRRGSILSVCAFLILATGIDDVFLTIHTWQRVSKSAKHGKITNDNIAERLALILCEIGPSMLISALTNIFSDVVGCFTGSPEITLLCIGNIACVVVDFVYQTTLFFALMAFICRWEMSTEKKRMPDSSSAKVPRELRTSLKQRFDGLLSQYIKLVTNRLAAVVICIVWVVFLAACFKSLLGIEINLTTSKLFPRDSPLLEIERYRENKVLPFYNLAYVFVNKPGNLTDPARRSQLERFVEDMEALPYAYGPEGTSYFMRDFETYERTQALGDANDTSDAEDDGPSSTTLSADNDTSLSMADLNDFLQWPEYEYWKSFLKCHKERNQTVLDGALITVAYHGQDLKGWYNRAHLLKQWRQVVDGYANEFNISVLHSDGLYLDLLDNMPTDIWQSALATLLCMAAICLVFMAEFFVVVVATLVIASVMLATLGIMAFQGMTMDPIVMASLVVSIGFSVDIPAHVSYHFHKAGKDETGASVQHRFREALYSVGYPSVQGSLSTNACILCLFLVPLYMAHVFARVMCLCMALCAIHSLVLLPAMFTLLARINELWQDGSAQKAAVEATEQEDSIEAAQANS